jgi:hypothetical protein
MTMSNLLKVTSYEECFSNYAGPVGQGILTAAEIEQHFPSSYREQPLVLAAIEGYAVAKRGQLAGALGSTAVNLSYINMEMMAATNYFQSIVSEEIGAHALNNMLVSSSYRSKGVRRMSEKATVYDYEVITGEKRQQPIPDAVAGELIFRLPDPDNTHPLDELVLELQDHFGLPDVYPGGLQAVAIGSSDNDSSAKNYPYRKLIVPYGHNGFASLAELRVLSSKEKRYDIETRPAYVKKRYAKYLKAEAYLA